MSKQVQPSTPLSARSAPKVTVVVGAQWGDEGKGKWVDILAAHAHMVVRYQGGNNAGHTLYIDGQKYVLHQIPSGALRDGQICALASGVVINPAELVVELNKIRSQRSLGPERLWISARAHVITPWHVHLDAERENATGSAIGTTRRGIGPTYSAKAARTGLRSGIFVDPARRAAWTESMAAADPAFAEFRRTHADLWQRFDEAAEILAPYVCDAEANIRAAVHEGRALLLEGAQGTLLDLDHGTFPFVTSSSTSAGGAATSIGLPPRHITRVVGIAKAYVTRVGGGPLPTEIAGPVGQDIATRGHEFGATTGRARRVGWFDSVAMRHSMDVNGFDDLVLNKMDILTGVPELKICVAYRHKTLGRLTRMPWDAEILAACEPEYISMEGWTQKLPLHGSFTDLPPAARRFIDAVEESAGVRVSHVGTGPARGEMLARD
jgi:adenylosuccinate synthase